MTTISPSGILTPREEWNDADFDFPDEDPIHTSDAESEKEEEGGGDEDWDIEMDLGKTGGAKARAVIGSMTVAAQASSSAGDESRTFTIRPPLTAIGDEDEEDDGIPTIKALVLPKIPSRAALEATIDEDFEDGLALPSDLTRLSLRPLELNHRASKSSLEWGDKDHTTSSQSSDAYSTLGFADHSPPSTVYTSASLPETETEEEEDESEDMLDGLVVPSGLFESGQSAKKLTKMLETKKKAVVTDMRVKIASPDLEDDFESGLVFDSGMELSPSRLLQAAQQTMKHGSALRSKSVPRASTQARPHSRAKSDRAKSPNVPPISSSHQLRKLACPPSPPKPSSSSRTQTYSQAATSGPTLSTKSSFLGPKFSSLRGQKSHIVLKAPSPSSSRRLSRKASLPSLSDHSPTQPTPSRLPDMPALSRYNAPTVSSKAKNHTSSTGRLHTFDYNVPPTRPSTPSSNPTALRLTMPTSSSRLKVRLPISNVFLPSPATSEPSPLPRSTSPLPAISRPPSALSSRPPSSKARHSQTQSLPAVPAAAKVLKRPKRTRTYGDGTELDGIEDLPLDREKEGKYRVQPKGAGTRIPGASYASIVAPSLSRKLQTAESSMYHSMSNARDC